MAKAVLYVCTTCRRGEAPDDPRPGAEMLRALESEVLPADVELRGVECLSACSNGCSVALSAPGKWSYVYGNLDPGVHAAAIAAGAALYAESVDGLVPWRARPEIFRKQSIARVPPLPESFPTPTQG
jgi:predicted metal-binding protein